MISSYSFTQHASLEMTPQIETLRSVQLLAKSQLVEDPLKKTRGQYHPTMADQDPEIDSTTNRWARPTRVRTSSIHSLYHK